MMNVDQTATSHPAHGWAEVFSVAKLRLARRAFQRLTMTVALALAACTTAPTLATMGAGAAQSTMQFTRGQLSRIWTRAPGALVMIQRTYNGDGEQFIGLQNDSSLAGDNFMWLRANSGRSGQIGDRLNLNLMVERVGGVPAPFQTLDNNNLRSGEDSLGPFFWQEYRTGAQTNCVLAIRRLKNGALALPPGARVLEVMLRNCVNGSIEEALSPIRDGKITRTAMRADLSPSEASRLLSPLAAPRQ